MACVHWSWEQYAKDLVQSHDHLTKLKCIELGVGEPGTSENWGDFHVQDIGRRGQASKSCYKIKANNLFISYNGIRIRVTYN